MGAFYLSIGTIGTKIGTNGITFIHWWNESHYGDLKYFRLL